MSLNEVSLRIPTEHMANVFGQFDANIKKIERTLGVTVVVRDDQLKLSVLHLPQAVHRKCLNSCMSLQNGEMLSANRM